MASSTSTARPSAVRAAAAAVLAGVASAGLGLAAARAVESARGGHVAVEHVVAAGALVAGALAGVALTVGCALLVVAGATRARGARHRRAEAWAARLTPAVLRRLLAAGVASSLGLAAVGGPALAEEIDVGWQVTSPSADDAASAAPGDGVAGDGVPEGAAGDGGGVLPVAAAVPLAEPAPTGPAAAAPAPDPAERAPAAPRTVVVRPGDCLWGIAAAHLPAGASDAEIAAAWPRLYAANRDVIGPDPDLIHPGQVLLIPLEETP